MEGDNSAAVAGMIALGAVALLGVLFYILFVGQSQDMTHLHNDIYALDGAIDAAATTQAATPAAATPAATERPTLRPAPAADPTAATQLGGVTIPAPAATTKPALDQATIEQLLKDIAAGKGAAYGPLLEMVLSGEEPAAVQGAISPLFTNGTDPGANVDALAALTTALKTGAPPPASAGSGLSTNLLVMYEMLADSLATSSMLSDSTRSLLDTIRSKKCELKFAADPEKLKTCLVVAMDRPATATAPAPVTPPLGTPPTVAVGGKNYVRADGLITNVDGVEVTFSFSKRQLSTCDAGSCNALPLMADPLRDYRVPA